MVGVAVVVVVVVEGRPEVIDIKGIKARLARVAGKWPTKGVLAPGADAFGPKAWSAHGPLRCHATETGSARGWTQANADADFIAAAPSDIAALVAEVERLRSINDGYLLEMGRQHALLRDQKRGENAERAAVVAWLHDIARQVGETPAASEEARAALQRAIDGTADAIERGEHRRKGGE